MFGKGYRIRASDKYLVYHFSLVSLVPVSLAVLVLFHQGSMESVDWQNLSGLPSAITGDTPWLVCSVVTTIGTCLLLTFIYCFYCSSHLKQLVHRQKLARMFIENQWYESEQVNSKGFLKIYLVIKQRKKLLVFQKLITDYTKV